MSKWIMTLLCAVSVVAIGQNMDAEPIALEPVIERISEEQDGSGRFSISIPGTLEIQAVFPSQPEIPVCPENDMDEEDDEDDEMAICSMMCCVESEGTMALVFYIPSDLEYDLSRAEERERYLQDTLREAQEVCERGLVPDCQIKTVQLDPMTSLSGESIPVCEVEILIPCDKIMIRTLHRVHVLRVGVVVAMITQVCHDPANAATVKSDKFQRLLETLEFSY